MRKIVKKKTQRNINCIWIRRPDLKRQTIKKQTLLQVGRIKAFLLLFPQNSLETVRGIDNGKRKGKISILNKRRKWSRPMEWLWEMRACPGGDPVSTECREESRVKGGMLPAVCVILTSLPIDEAFWIKAGLIEDRRQCYQVTTHPVTESLWFKGLCCAPHKHWIPQTEECF